LHILYDRMMLTHLTLISALDNDTYALGSNSLWHVANLTMVVTTKHRSLAWDDFLEDAPIESNPNFCLNLKWLDKIRSNSVICNVNDMRETTEID
jgi:hypothetical protein